MQVVPVPCPDPPGHQLRNTDPASDDRKHRQHHERHGHRTGRLVRLVQRFPVTAERAEEDQPGQPGHVKRGDERAAEQHGPDHPMASGPGGGQDLVLGKETRERRNARDGQAGYTEGEKRDRHLAAQPAHAADVLLSV